jgi:uncharacterized protein YukE
MSGFAVTPAALRDSAQTIQPLAERFGGLGPELLEAAEAAAAVNPEYLTSAAANELAAEIIQAMTAVADALTAHAGGLGNSAATYESTEDRAKWMMYRVGKGVPPGATYA